MNHEHLPALKRYTSAKQYEAMQKINDTQSVVKLLMDGAWSRTLGALLRSAWIAPHTYTDADGVVREGWQVTDAGRHAMTLYEAKLEEQRQTEERQERLRQEQLAREAELFGMAVGYFRAVKVQGAYEQMADDWRRKSKELEYECNRFAMERNVWGSKQVFAKAFAAVKEEGAIDLESYEEWKERQMEGYEE
jgi:hypothetical protein